MKFRSLLISLIAVILITTMFVSAYAYGSEQSGDFTIRGGATFGMTMDEISTIEESNGNSDIVIDHDKNLLQLKEEYIAGVAIGRCRSENVRYYFDTNGQFEELHYWFGYYDSASLYSNSFSTVNSLLADKYGEPLHNNDESVFVVDGRAWKNYVDYHFSLKDYSQWLLKFDTYYAVCDLVGVYSDNTGAYQIDMSYKLLSNDYVDSVLQEYADNNADKQASADNDI